jgi:hypothetical protein
MDRLDQMLSLTGIAKNKKALKGLLCEILISITYPVKSYCIKNKLNELLEEIKMPYSIFMGMGTQTLIKKAQKIHDLLLPLIEDLQDAGVAVTAADFTVLQQAIVSFDHAANAPLEAVGDRKAINEKINALVREANSICHNILDENIISFKPIDLDYFKEYKVKRQVPKQIRYTGLDASLTFEEGTPCAYMTVTVDAFTKKGKTYEAVSAFADENGLAEVREFEEGLRHVTVSGDGIVTKTYGPYLFEKGKATIVSLTCQPAFNIPAPQPTQKNQKA